MNEKGEQYMFSHAKKEAGFTIFSSDLGHPPLSMVQCSEIKMKGKCNYNHLQGQKRLRRVERVN